MSVYKTVIALFSDFSRFLGELEQCIDNPVKVARCFVEHSEGFVIYSEYCSNYPRFVVAIFDSLKVAKSLYYNCRNTSKKFRLQLPENLQQTTTRISLYMVYFLAF